MQLVKSLSAVILGGLLFASSTFAATGGYSGSACNPNTPTDGSRINYTQFGVHNVSSAVANVTCPANQPSGSDIFNISATVYDRSTTTDVCCTMMVLNSDGLIIASAAPCSAGFGSGSQPLSFVPPFNASSTVELACSIPGVTANGFSHVATYRVASTP